MANTFDIGLKSKLKTFAEKFSIDTKTIDEKDWFELFSKYVVVSTTIKEDVDDPNSMIQKKSVAEKLDFLSDFENVKTLFSDVNSILES